jgi:hypothetical protein
MYENFHLYIDLDLKKYEDDDYLKKVHQIIQLAYQHRLSVFCSKSLIDEFKDILGIDDSFRHSAANRLVV